MAKCEKVFNVLQKQLLMMPFILDGKVDHFDNNN